ncbi:MAG: acyl-CoA dehydrogenase C-terminal domain-containing protein, partial [Pseudomonadales bacterium]
KDTDAQALAELLTPVAKAFLSDRGFDCAVIAQQVFGGHGYVKEWGVEQIVRDVRIAQIYEGANGIQALDLVGRKVLRDDGKTLRALADRMAASEIPEQFQDRLHATVDRLIRVTASIVDRAADDPTLAGAVSTDYLDLLGYTVYAWLWATMAGVAPDDDFGTAKKQCAEFYFARILPRTLGLEASICAASSAVMELPESAF